MNCFLNQRAAIFTMAVLVCGLMLIGCVATQRDAAEIKAKLDRVESHLGRTDDAISHMDSVVTAGAEADNRMRADIRLTMDELNDQINRLLENYNGLLQKIDELSRQPKTIIRSSPGASEPQTHVDSPNEPPAAPSIDCDSTYDESFIQVRRNEYAQAADGFASFIASCPEHPDVANAHYWAGECFYNQQKYDAAIEQYQKIMTSFKNSPKLTQAIYKVARSKEEQGKKAEAKTLFQQLVDDYAGTLEGEQAKARLKDL